MRLRVLLIVTIVIGLGAIAVSQFLVRPHIQKIIAVRDKNLQEYQNEHRIHDVTRGSLEDAQTKLNATEKNLDTTKTQLAVVATRATEQEQRITVLTSDLTTTRQYLASAKADLAAWTALSIPVDQVRTLTAEVKKLTAANEALQEEMNILASLLKKANERIAGVTGSQETDPALPAGLKGKVLVVDPIYDFVVLDIGADKGVETRGVLMVVRQSELVGKIRVASVQSERSIANVIPGWKLREIKEGDLVLY